MSPSSWRESADPLEARKEFLVPEFRADQGLALGSPVFADESAVKAVFRELADHRHDNFLDAVVEAGNLFGFQQDVHQILIEPPHFPGNVEWHAGHAADDKGIGVFFNCFLHIPVGFIRFVIGEFISFHCVQVVHHALFNFAFRGGIDPAPQVAPIVVADPFLLVHLLPVGSMGIDRDRAGADNIGFREKNGLPARDFQS